MLMRCCSLFVLLLSIAAIARTDAAEPLVVEAIVNAPAAKVWQAFTTSAGYAEVGVPNVTVELRIGGAIGTPSMSDPASRTVNQIVSFEPERLLVTRVQQASAGFPAGASFANAWTLIYLTPLGQDMTHVRIAGMGYNEGAAATELTRFFEQDAAAHLKRLEKHYWPLCALCKKE